MKWVLYGRSELGEIGRVRVKCSVMTKISDGEGSIPGPDWRCGPEAWDAY